MIPGDPPPQDSDGGRDTASFEAGWRERFREFASSADDDAGIAGWSTTGLAARLRRFRTLWLAHSPGGNWLDAGCGAGTYARFLAAEEMNVIGIDYSATAVAKARTRSPPAIRYAVADVRVLPFRVASFDGVLCFGVTQALSESGAAVRALAAVVGSGGEIWIDGLNSGCLANLWTIGCRKLRRRPAHLRYEWPSAIAAILRSEGFDAVAVHWLPIVPSRWPLVQRALESASARRLFRVIPLFGLILSHSFVVRAERPAALGRIDAVVR